VHDAGSGLATVVLTRFKPVGRVLSDDAGAVCFGSSTALLTP